MAARSKQTDQRKRSSIQQSSRETGSEAHQTAAGAIQSSTQDIQSAAMNPRQASPAQLLEMQRRYGNRFVQRLLSAGAPADPRPHEQNLPQTVSRAVQPGFRQGGSLDAPSQGQIERARGGGSPLDANAGAQIGDALSADFSRVKVHTNPKADALNRSLSAKAFTTGSDIFFSRGAYQPGSSSGKQLLAHELIHVVQQGGAKPNQAGTEQSRGLQSKHTTAMPKGACGAVGPNSVQFKLTVGTGAGIVHRKLNKGIQAGTKVIKHEYGGDVDHYEIAKAAGYNYSIKNTKTDEIISTVSANDPGWCREGDTESRKQWLQAKDEEGLAAGHNYVSADYHKINPLLGALSAEGYTPEQVVDPSLDVTSKQEQIIETWRKISVERGNIGLHDQGQLDAAALERYLNMFKGMHRVWGKFGKKPIPNGVVCRGDSVALYKSYDFLDPAKNDYPDGELPMSRTINWPGVMSTTVGDPKEHNFIQKKNVVWKLQVPEHHAGKILGKNESEAEATFPVNTSVQIEKVIVRRVNKEFLAAEFGENAELIIMARITSTEEPSEKLGGQSGLEEATEGQSGKASTPMPPTIPPVTSRPPPPPPPPRRLPPSGVPTLAPTKKVLSPHEQMQLELFKKRLEKTTDKESDEAKELTQKISALEGAQEPIPTKKVLSPHEQMQLELFKKRLEKTTDKESDEAKELTQKISALEGAQPEPPRKKGVLSQEERLKRLRIQESIVEQFLNGVPEVPISEQPKAILMMGGPGAGKSSALPQVAPDTSKFVQTNPDTIKERLPEYKTGIEQDDTGIADQLHNESKLIADDLASKAIAGRRHLLYDATGVNITDYSALIKALKKAGYRVTLVMVHVPKEEGLRRMRERALEEKRHVDENFARSAYPAISANFIQLAPLVDVALMYDNMVAKGEKPKLVWTQKGELEEARKILSVNESPLEESSKRKPQGGSQQKEDEPVTKSPMLPSSSAKGGTSQPPSSPLSTSSSGGRQHEGLVVPSLDQRIQATGGDRKRLIMLLVRLTVSQRRDLRESYQEDLDLVLGYPDRVDEDIQKIVIGILDEIEELEREREDNGKPGRDPWGGDDRDAPGGWGKGHPLGQQPSGVLVH